MLAVTETMHTGGAGAGGDTHAGGRAAAGGDAGARDGAAVGGGPPRLSPAGVVATALGTYRRCFWRVAVAALLIMVPVDAAVSLLESAVDIPQGESALALGARIAVIVADAAAATIGTTFFAGMLDRVVAVDQHGHQDAPLLTVLREVPVARLILADLAAVGLIVLGTVAFVVPGVILAVLLAVVGPVLVIEDLGVWPSLRRSMQLVRPHALLTFFFVLLPSGAEEWVVSRAEHAVHGNTVLWLIADVVTTAVVGSFVGILEITLAHGLIADHARRLARKTATARGRQTGTGPAA